MKKELLITKYLLGEASLQEAAEVEAWLSANEIDRQQYDGLKYAWDQSWEPIPVASWDEKKAWLYFKEKVKAGTFTKPSVPIYRHQRKWWIAAAIFLTTCCTWWMLKRAQHSIGKKVAIVTQSTDRKPVAEISISIHRDTVTGPCKMTLPDGSLVSLKKNAQLCYQIPFGESIRKVQLSGEGFFQVHHDTAKPFVVNVNDLAVKVVGTSFVVWGEKYSTKVEVKTGKVKIIRAKDSIQLVKGDKIRVGIHENGKLHVINPLSETWHKQQAIVKDILYTLVSTGKFSAASEIVSFKLTDTDFTVNGVKFRNELLFNQLKQKYISLPGFGIYYGEERMNGDKGFHVDRIKLK